LRSSTIWNPALHASFQPLPGSAFTVFGAPIAQLGADHHERRTALRAEPDGEFASDSQTYAGTGTLRYTW
jgi:hypothetical protein